jgi:hypothetical protein
MDLGIAGRKAIVGASSRGRRGNRHRSVSPPHHKAVDCTKRYIRRTWNIAI